MAISPKRAKDRIKYSINWNLSLDEGDTIDGLAIVTATNGMEIEDLTTSNGISTFFVSGGSSAEATRLTGCIEGEINTTNGEVLTACEPLIILPECGTGATSC